MSVWLSVAYVIQICFILTAWLLSVVITWCLIHVIVIQRIESVMKINIIVRRLSVWTSIFYFIALLTQLIGHIVNNSIYWEGIAYTISQITWVFANCCIYCLFMVRIHLTFKNSAYRIHYCVFIIILIFVLGYGIGELMFPFWELLSVYSSFNLNNQTKYKSFMIFNVVISDFIVSVSLSILFIRKLIVVSKNLQDVPLADDENLVRTKQFQLFYVITKQTILSVCGTMTTQILLLYNIYQLHVQNYYHNDYELKYTLYTINGFLYSLDCIINSLMALLSFTHFTNAYHRICASCHRCVFKVVNKKLLLLNTNEDHVMLLLN